MTEDGGTLPDDTIELDAAALRAWPLPLPEREGDKEERGRVLVVAGSRQIAGAVVLAATAALRAGAGKVAIATSAAIAHFVAFAVPESRVFALDESPDGGIAAGTLDALDAIAPHVASVLIGPGLPYTPVTQALAAEVLERFAHASVIVDAGAMRVIDTQRRFYAPVVMTPHAGEMASLTRGDKATIIEEPRRAALEAARTWNAVVALKGAITYIAAPDGRVWRNRAGNPGLATSGSGDVLAGIMAGLAARGAPLEQASAWAVALHARAGDRLAQRIGPLGYLARELPGEVPGLMAELG